MLLGTCPAFAWKGNFIGHILADAAKYIIESALYALVLCGENLISDIGSVLWVYTCKGVFYIHKNFFKKLSIFRRCSYFHSCYGVKGRYFTLFQMGAEGGELLWSNLLPKSS